jgi:hypothetical protein
MTKSENSMPSTETANDTMHAKMINQTTRLRAGVFVDSEYMREHCYFGYLTHPALEYDIAVAITIDDVRKFSKINKLVLSKEGDVEYRFGILTPTADKSGVAGYSAKCFIDGKLHEFFIYQSQYEEIVERGFSINITQEGKMYEKLVNL